HGVFHQERDLHASLLGLALRPLDGYIEEVDARHLAAPPGEEQGRVPGATACVENRASDAVGHVEKRLLRLADVPGGLAGVQGLKRGPVGYRRHGRSPPFLPVTLRCASA